MLLSTGARLGPYEIIAPLGAGGRGEVYKARDTRLDRTVAIKILPETLAADRQFRERFDREARAISQLDHPHICALFDVGQHDSTAFLVMQYLEGQTLTGGEPAPLFMTHLAQGAAITGTRSQYAVAADGRFLMNAIVEETAPTPPIIVIVNWAARLKK
jgi:serine/threonine protein kinase